MARYVRTRVVKPCRLTMPSTSGLFQTTPEKDQMKSLTLSGRSFHRPVKCIAAGEKGLCKTTMPSTLGLTS